MPDLTENYPRVTHPFATTAIQYCYSLAIVRLACLIHAASVRSEPESNSPNKKYTNFLSHILEFKEQKSRQNLFQVCRLSFALFARDADKLFHTPGRVKSFAEVFSKGSNNTRYLQPLANPGVLDAVLSEFHDSVVRGCVIAATDLLSGRSALP